MNIKDISTKISNPTLCSSNDIESFSQLTESYPYAQIFSILYLKSLSKDGALFFDEALYKNAYKITDRSKLYHFLNENTTLEAIDLQNNVISHVEIESTEGAKTIEKQIIDETIQEPIPKKERELDIEIISHVISHAFGDEVESVDEDIESINTKNSNKLVSIKNEEPTKEIKPTPKTFTEWLKNGETAKNPSQKKSKNEIIDSFIEIEPSISKPIKEFYSPIKQAQKSVDDDSIVYSETLASILALQGNYPRAIIAYEQLCLTIPEKKVYFVQKIKELKEKLTT